KSILSPQLFTNFMERTTEASGPAPLLRASSKKGAAPRRTAPFLLYSNLLSGEQIDQFIPAFAGHYFPPMGIRQDQGQLLFIRTQFPGNRLDDFNLFPVEIPGCQPMHYLVSHMAHEPYEFRVLTELF